MSARRYAVGVAGGRDVVESLWLVEDIDHEEELTRMRSAAAGGADEKEARQPGGADEKEERQRGGARSVSNEELMGRRSP